MPGSVVVDPDASPSAIHVIAYSGDSFEERRNVPVDELRGMLGRHRVLWVNVEGLGNAAVIEELGRLFKLHPLSLEDVVHVHQRAKVEDYGDHLFIVARMVSYDGQLAHEQLSIFLGKNFIVSFLEDPGDCLDPVRERLRKARGPARDRGTDYLAYAILDAVIDAYFPVLDAYDRQLDELDDEIMESVGVHSLGPLHSVRTDLRLLRRSIGPHREAVNELLRDGHPLISPETRIHLRDCYDHTVQIIDAIDIYRELCSDLREYYVSKMSARTNDIMKVLTIIATIFIPLGFIAGVYGMNFDTHVSPWNMPELEWAFGYPMALGLMVVVAGGLVYYFWRKGWLRDRHVK